MKKANTSKIAVLGAGAMGARMAQRLIEEGNEVVVYNRTADKLTHLINAGAKPAASPQEAVSQSDIIISMVRDDEASKAIWKGGGLAGLTSGHIVIESSTLTPDWTIELSQSIEKAGASFLDAPVVGSRPHAEAGKLAFLAGGEAEVLQQVESILKQMGGAVYYAGPIGSGMMLKLVVNTLFAVQVGTLAELLSALQNAGLKGGDVVEILNALPTASPAAMRVSTLMMDKAFSPNFPIHLVAKDMTYAATFARNNNVDGVITEAVRNIYVNAEKEGLGGSDICGIIQLHAGKVATTS